MHQCADLGQQRRGQRQGAPVVVLVAQRVGQDECSEAVTLDGGDFVALRARAAIRGETAYTVWPAICSRSTSSPSERSTAIGMLAANRCNTFASSDKPATS